MLLYGVQLSKDRELINLHLESDSLVLIHILQGRSMCPWSLQREVQELFQYGHFFNDISHCSREANRPADRLCKVRVDSRESVGL